MADFAPNYTARYRLKYSVVGKAHKAMIRLLDAPDYPVIEATGVSIFTDLLNNLSTLLWNDFTVLGAEGCLKDSSVFLPLSYPVFSGTVSSATRPASAAALALSFVGRTSGGLRWSLYMFGANLNPQTNAISQDFRVGRGESAPIQAAIDGLAARQTDMCGNDGIAVNVYPYVNVKYNDYWTKKLRTG